MTEGAAGGDRGRYHLRSSSATFGEVPRKSKTPYPFPCPINEDDGSPAPFYNELDGSCKKWHILVIRPHNYHRVPYLSREKAFEVGYGSITSISSDITGYLLPYNPNISTNRMSKEVVVKLLMSLELREGVYWLHPDMLTGDIAPYYMVALPKYYFTNFPILPIPKFISDILNMSGMYISQLGATFFFYAHGFLNVLRNLGIKPNTNLFFNYFSLSVASLSDILISCSSRVASSHHFQLIRDPLTKRKNDDLFSSMPACVLILCRPMYWLSIELLSSNLFLALKSLSKFGC